MGEVDQEIKKLFQEFLSIATETRAKIEQIDCSIDSLARCSQKCRLTKMEFQTIPENVNTYQSVGRLFFKSPRNDVQKSLEEKIKSNDEKIKVLEKEKAYLTTCLKERENSLREVVSQKQGRS